MRFADYLSLALRSVRRSRLRSGLTIGAIVIGATGITVMLTFVTSVKDYVVQKFENTGEALLVQVAQQADLDFNPGGQVFGGGTVTTEQQVILSDETEAKLRAIPGVEAVAAIGHFGSPFQSMTINGKELQAERITGIEPTGAVRPTLAAGRAFGAGDTTGVVILTGDFADAAGVAAEKLVGSTVTLRTRPGWTGQPLDQLPIELPPQNQCQPEQRNCFGGPTSGLPTTDIEAKVVGVTGGDGEQGAIFMPLAWLVSLSNEARPRNVQYQPQPGVRPGRVVGGWDRPSDTEFIVQRGGYASFTVLAKTNDDVESIATAVQGLGLNSVTGLAELEEQKKAANAIGLVLGGLGLIALLIASLGIMNTMVMSVLERTREIGVMRAVGARRSTIRRLFTFEAATLGFLGGVIGVAIGYAGVFLGKAAIRSAVSSGDITETNFSVPLWLVVIVIAGTTAIGTLSGLIPSRRAARLDPVEALRHE